MHIPPNGLHCACEDNPQEGTILWDRVLSKPFVYWFEFIAFKLFFPFSFTCVCEGGGVVVRLCGGGETQAFLIQF